MVRQGRAKEADSHAWSSRRQDAIAFRTAADHLLAAAQEGQNCNPIIVLVAHAATAYGDALTARFGGVLNRDKHEDLVTRVKTAMKGKADGPQLKRLAELLADKTAYSYGAKIGRTVDAQDKFQKLQRFAEWAEQQLTNAT